MELVRNDLKPEAASDRQPGLPRPLVVIALLSVYALALGLASTHLQPNAVLALGLVPSVVFALYAILLDRAARARLVRNVDRIESDIRLRLSTYDPAAAAFAQSYVHTRLDDEILRSQRYNLSLSVIVVSLDMSRAGADLASLTATVVRIASSLLRAEDIVGHLGGFEYVFCLPHTDARGAEVVFDRLMHELSPYAPSAGIAVLEAGSNMTSESMLKTAREGAARRISSEATSRIWNELAHAT